jgi:hypothetical protein
MRYSFWAEQIVPGVLDTDGHFFPLESIERTFNRDSNGNITTVVATDGTNSWTQTYNYKNGYVSHISAWVQNQSTTVPTTPTGPATPSVPVTASMRFNVATNTQYLGML